jgi:polysaccharide deacetylase family protein (PEP-CTERM system associated)
MTEHLDDGGSRAIDVLSVDLEDWYHAFASVTPDRWEGFEDRIVESTGRLLDLLAQAEVRATFFVLGYVADRFPPLIEAVVDAGHEIGLHSYAHQRVSRLSPDQFRADLERGLTAVEKASGHRVVGYRAPMFSINRSGLWALEILKEMGFRYDSSIFPIQNFYYGDPDAPRFPFHPFNDSFVEFPLSTVRLFGVNWPVAGGFYLRTLPFPFIKWGLRRINKEGQPVILYLHPWDLDPAQPRRLTTPRERVTHYHNLHKTAARLSALLKEFRFGPFVQLLEDETSIKREGLWMSRN